MNITKDTRVYDIIKEYGDIAPVMENFGVKKVGNFSIRRILTRFISIEKAAKIHKEPLDEFLEKVRNSIKLHEEKEI